MQLMVKTIEKGKTIILKNEFITNMLKLNKSNLRKAKKKHEGQTEYDEDVSR